MTIYRLSPKFWAAMRQTLLRLFALWLAIITPLTWAAGEIWTPLSGLYGHTYTIFTLVADHSGNLYASAGTDGVFKSSDGGNSWAALNIGLNNTYISRLAIDSNDNLYALSNNHYYTDSGNVFKLSRGAGTWTLLNTGVDGDVIKTFVADSSGNLYAATSSNNIFKLNRGASTWAPINTGLDGYARYIQALVIDRSDNLYAGTGAGVFKLNRDDSAWTAINKGLTDQNSNGIDIYSLAMDNIGNLYIGTAAQGMYKRSNGGDAWVAINDGLADQNGHFPSISHITIDSSGNLYGGDNSSLFKRSSADNGWKSVGNLSDLSINALITDGGSNVLIGTTAGMRKLTSGANTWTVANTGLKQLNPTVHALFIDHRGKLYAGTDGGVFQHGDGSNDWIDLGLTNHDIYAIAGDHVGNLYAGAKSSKSGAFKLGKGASAWSAISSGLVFYDPWHENSYPLPLTAFWVDGGDNFYAGTDYSGGVFQSKDGGKGWAPLHLGMVTESILLTYADPLSQVSPSILSLTIDSNNNVYAGTAEGHVFKLSSGASAWSAVNSRLTNQPVPALAADSQGNLYASVTLGGVFKSSNGAWTPMNNGLTALGVSTLTTDHRDNLYAGTNTGVFKLARGASTWVNIGLTDQSIVSFAIDNNGRLYAGTNSGVFQLNTGEIATPWTTSLSPSGPLSNRTLAVSITPSSADLSQPGCIYVAATSQNLGPLALDANGWRPFDSNRPVFYSIGKLAPTQITLVSNTNLTALLGVQLYAGYGLGSTASTCLADMLESNLLKQVYTVQ